MVFLGCYRQRHRRETPGFFRLGRPLRPGVARSRFKDDDYWEPQKWSGKALEDALTELAKRTHRKNFTLLYYGYSAGGQSANLFYAWQPKQVIAWGAHGCGVWCDPAKIPTPCPALITCGIQDKERWEISRNFVQRAGESGWRRTWCDLPGDHEFSPAALQLAHSFFTAVLNNEKPIYWGDDQTGKLLPRPGKSSGTAQLASWRNAENAMAKTDGAALIPWSSLIKAWYANGSDSTIRTMRRPCWPCCCRCCGVCTAAIVLPVGVNFCVGPVN